MTIPQSTTIQAYQLHHGGAPARLAILRSMAADSVNNANPLTRHDPKDWRKARNWTMGGYAAAYIHGLHAGANDTRAVWYCHTGPQFRGEKYADECDGVGRSIDHNGWFTDVYCSEKARGIVAQLPHGRFIAGYFWDSNGERVYFGDVYDDEKDAACAADSHAESFAEVSREESEKYEAARELESDIEEAIDELGEALALRNHARYGEAKRDTARELIETIRAKREELKTDYLNYI